LRRQAVSTESDEILRFKDLELNPLTYQATIGGEPIDLTYMEYELLRFLVENPRRVWRRQQLLSKVWGYDYYGGARTVHVHVRRVRAKLGEARGAWITAVRSAGYRFGCAARIPLTDGPEPVPHWAHGFPYRPAPRRCRPRPVDRSDPHPHPSVDHVRPGLGRRIHVQGLQLCPRRQPHRSGIRAEDRRPGRGRRGHRLRVGNGRNRRRDARLARIGRPRRDRRRRLRRHVPVR